MSLDGIQHLSIVVLGEEDGSVRKKTVMQEEVAWALGTLLLHFLSKVVTDVFATQQIMIDINGHSPSHAGMWIDEGGGLIVSVGKSSIAWVRGDLRDDLMGMLRLVGACCGPT